MKTLIKTGTRCYLQHLHRIIERYLFNNGKFANLGVIFLFLSVRRKNRNSNRLRVFSQLLNNAKIMTSKSGLALTATVLQIRSFSAVLVQACMILPQTCLSVKQTERRRKKIKEIKFSKSLSQNVYPAVLLDVPRCYALHVREFVGLLP